MSRTPLLGAALVLAASAACVAGSERAEHSDSALTAMNMFDPASAQVGDTIVGLVIEDMRRERASTGDWIGSARFAGILAVNGQTFAHPDGADYPFPCFQVDSASARQLPRWKGDERRPWFCFENSSEARSTLGGSAPGRLFSIRIDRFTIHRNLTDAVNSARLLGPAADGRSSAGSATECFRTTTSVLARRPGTVADGPARLSGWIQVNRRTFADSGSGRLVDSDGRSLGAFWRRISADSMAVTAFDDFLRVEMRLLMRDSLATGSARAYSDAALERDSTGQRVEFRREWDVTARRASCGTLPSTTRP